MDFFTGVTLDTMLVNNLFSHFSPPESKFILPYLYVSRRSCSRSCLTEANGCDSWRPLKLLFTTSTDLYFPLMITISTHSVFYWLRLIVRIPVGSIGSFSVSLLQVDFPQTLHTIFILFPLSKLPFQVSAQLCFIRCSTRKPDGSTSSSNAIMSSCIPLII